MHKPECSAMTTFGEKWSPSDMARLVARILAKKVGWLRKEGQCDGFSTSLSLFSHRACAPQKVQTERSASERTLLIGEMQSRELPLIQHRR